MKRRDFLKMSAKAIDIFYKHGPLDGCELQILMSTDYRDNATILDGLLSEQKLVVNAELAKYDLSSSLRQEIEAA